MKLFKQISWTLPLILATVFLGCNQNQTDERAVETNDVMEETKEAMETTKDYFQQEKDSVKLKLNEQANNLDKKIKQVKADLVAAKDNTKTKLQAKASALQKRREELQTKYDQVEAATEETWEEIKADLKDYFNDLKKEEEKERSQSKS